MENDVNLYTSSLSPENWPFIFLHRASLLCNTNTVMDLKNVSCS